MHFSMSIMITTIFVGPFTLSALAIPAPTSYDARLSDAELVSHAPLVLNSKVLLQDASLASVPKGAAHVRNLCSFKVYLYVCGQGLDNGGVPACGAETTLAAKTGQYHETYFSVDNGRSIALGRAPGKARKPILQLEYTNTGEGKVSYDLSEIDGNPFGQWGFTLTSSNRQCFRSHCTPPATACPGVFTQPTNGTPQECPIQDGIGVTLCD